MRLKSKPKKLEINLLVLFYIVILLVFLSYFLTSYLKYKTILQEYIAVREAYEKSKKELAEKEETLKKLQKLVEDLEKEKGDNESRNATRY